MKKNVTFSLLMIRGDAPLTSLEAVTKLFLSRLLTLPPVCSASLTIPCAYNACSACTIYCACSACKAFYMPASPAMLTVTMLAKLHSCSTNCPASLHQASTVGSSRCPLCMNHNPFGVGSLGFHGSQGGQGQELGDSGFLLPGGATVCMRRVAIYIERLIETC